MKHKPMWRTLGMLVVAGISVAAVAQMPSAKASSKSTHSVLAREFEIRKASKNCAPTAPIQTKLTAPGSSAVGAAIPIQFDAVLTSESVPAEMRVDLPAGVRLVSGKSSEQGSMQKDRALTWNHSIVVDRPGTYEVHVQLIAGNPGSKYGQRRTLYIKSNGNQLELSTEKIRPEPVLQQDPLPARLGNEKSNPFQLKRGNPPPVEGFNDKFDPFGAELDKVYTGNLTDAAVTVNGTWRYRHTDTTLRSGYGTWVEAWDDDTTGADDFLDRATVDGAGNYTLNFDNADDLGFGTADVYIVFRSENTRVQVHNTGATTGYSTSTGVIWPNIAGGTFTAPSYFADWGTNGISDSTERAFQLTDDVTTAWQYWRYYPGILFDNHYTYCQWYAGSTQGAFYRVNENRMFIHDDSVSSPDVIFHEYGHSMMDGLYDDVNYPPNSTGSHWFTNHYTVGLAWSEGFATYFGCAAQNYEKWYDSNDPGNLIHFDCELNYDGNGTPNGNSDGLSTGANQGYTTESAVLAMMLDVADPSNSPTDPYDWSSLGDNEIFDSMRNYMIAGHRAYEIQDFFDGWHSVVDVQNPKMNAQMHNHGMNQGISFPGLGIFDGVDGWSGTWYYGGYGRGSYDVKNYLSRNYNLNRLYVWLRGPGGEDIGQFGSDFDNDPIASGATRNIWITADQTGYNPAAPNFVYGNYTVTAGHYRSDNAWQLLEPAESGTSTQITKNVIQDTSAPPSCAVQDDGANQVSLTSIHITAQSSDPESSIDGYWTRVGSTQGSGNYQDWVFHDANNVTNWDYTITGLAIPNGATAYVTVVSQNIHSADSPFAYTDGIKCGDTTAPGAVTVTDAGIFAPRNTELAFLAQTTEPDGGIFQWWTRVGTSAGLGNVQDWIAHDVHVTSWNHTLTGLTMPTGQMYYITAVARNYGLMDTFGYSNGILSPLYPTSTNVQGGVGFGGNTASLQLSDNNRFMILCDENDATGQVQINTVSPVLGGSTLYVVVETSSSRSDQTMFTDLYVPGTSSWSNVDSRAATLADTAFTATRSPAATYVNQVTNGMNGRIRWIPTQDIDSGDGWTNSIDRFNWYIAP